MPDCQGKRHLDGRELVVLLEASPSEISSAEIVRDAIDAGLRWPSSYWPEQAVRWLEQGASMDAGIVTLLNTVAATRQFPQNLRHRALALARRFETSNDGS
jgi:hypothetical protein